MEILALVVIVSTVLMCAIVSVQKDPPQYYFGIHSEKSYFIYEVSSGGFLVTVNSINLDGVLVHKTYGSAIFKSDERKMQGSEIIDLYYGCRDKLNLDDQLFLDKLFVNMHSQRIYTDETDFVRVSCAIC